MESQRDYAKFLAKKFAHKSTAGIDADLSEYALFPHQRDLTAWALRRGRAAIFADTGLGKMRMELVWADVVTKHTGRDVIIFCPLAVAEQIVEEGRRIGVSVTHAREQGDCTTGINITNYERLHKFDPRLFGGVVLDESSIIKHQGSKTFSAFSDAFIDTPFKLPATATPAPNDWTELGNHAEFLGVRSRAEMLAEFFVHDGGETQTWRLKGHARQAFWEWVASWGAMVRSPADLGHDASMYDLPPLRVHQETVAAPHDAEDGLFSMPAQSLMERRQARRKSLSSRVGACADMVNSDDEIWLVWCDLNDEGNELQKAIPGSVQIAGADTVEHKERELLNFAAGRTRVLISKPSLAGFGLNFQVCHKIAFVGVTDSWESYYQAVRRCWRFGQKSPVDVYIFASEKEGSVVQNLARKEKDAKAMADAMAAETRGAVMSSVLGRNKETNDYSPRKIISLPTFMGEV